MIFRLDTDPSLFSTVQYHLWHVVLDDLPFYNPLLNSCSWVRTHWLAQDQQFLFQYKMDLTTLFNSQWFLSQAPDVHLSLSLSLERAPMPFLRKPRSFSKLRSHLPPEPETIHNPIPYLPGKLGGSFPCSQIGPSFLSHETTNLIREDQIFPSKYFTLSLL